MKTKIILAPSFELAKAVQATATVEAEYGANVVEGTFCTLAHHVKEYSDHPAPCNNAAVPVLPEGSTILVSHIDLDTVGGVMALLGIKPEDKAFWEAAEFIDLNGPHHGYKFPSELPKLQAYWAWNANQPRRTPSVESKDVTEVIESHADVISRIIKGDTELIEAGEKWAIETSEKVEGCLIEETERVRVFVMDDVFCSASYYSKTLDQIIPITVQMNTKMGSITVATCDGAINAKEIVQSLWGMEAGGHPGIAGSPRGKRMNLNDLVKAVEAVTK